MSGGAPRAAARAYAHAMPASHTAALSAPIDIRTLRKLWKPRRDSYADALLYEDSRIRIHRAFTWLERAAELPADALDERLLAQWAGLAALFSRWDRARRRPMPERTALAQFVRQVVAHDQDGLLAAALQRHKTLVQGLIGDRYLARYVPRPVDTQALYARRAWERLLGLSLERAELVHAQLSQGGSSFGSKENRAVLRRSTMLLDPVAVACVQVVTNHGYTDDWGDLCWPPERRSRGA